MSADRPADAELDGCDLEFDDPATNLADEDVDVFVMFTDVAGDPDAVARRAAELRGLADA